MSHGNRLSLITGALLALLVPLCPAPSLIELGTVTAIQGELTATATPNYIQALDRTRVTQIQTDLRTLATALDRYRADNGSYPAQVSFSSDYGPAPGEARVAHVYGFVARVQGGPGDLTHPTAYLTSLPSDPYSQPAVGRQLPYAYFIDRRTNHYLLWSAGPDNDYDLDPVRDFWSGNNADSDRLRRQMFDINDPNDTDGDIFHTNRPM
jgi:Tfp pilus assembly protein PilE